MSERKHKYTWNDLRPPAPPRSEKELELLSCLFQYPSAFDELQEMATEIQFESELHGKIFHVIQHLYQSDKSVSYSKLFETLNKDAKFQAQGITRIGYLLFASVEPSKERALELVFELMKPDDA